jgi:serine protease Do
MKKKILVGIAILLTGFLLGGLAFYGLAQLTRHRHMPYTSAPNIPKHVMETGKAFSEIVATVSPSVVNISTTKVVRSSSEPSEERFLDLFRPFEESESPRKWKERSLGSGVIVSQEGYIVTNNHVVEKADEIRVTLPDRRTFNGKIVGADSKADVAILRIDAQNLPVLKWGNSDALQVGEFVLAVGSPYGLSNTVTMGIISAVGRANVGIADYEDFIQTDAAINPGNSGGPLVNTHGQLIGINTAIFSRTGGYQGIGFAVPSNIVRIIMDQLILEGKVTRGWIGVSIQEVTAELAREFGLKKTNGALVSDVTKNSPAAKAGIRRGDIIVQFNGKDISEVSVLRNMVAQSRSGSSVMVKILREGKEVLLNVAIVEMPKEMAEAAPENTLSENPDSKILAGLSVMDLSREIVRQLGFSKEERGVIVVRVEPGSPADDAELRKGDIIKEMNRKEIKNLGDYHRVSAGIAKDGSVLLFVNRGGKNFYAILEAS